MKTLVQYLNEQLLSESGHIANKSDIAHVAREIVDFCVSVFGEEVSEWCVFDQWKKGSFFGQNLGGLAVNFTDSIKGYAQMDLVKEAGDELPYLKKKIDKEDYDSISHEACLKLNKKFIEDNIQKGNLDVMYSAVAHELTHLYEFLCGAEMKEATTDAEYAFSKTEMDARINQIYHLVQKMDLSKYDKYKGNMTQLISELMKDKRMQDAA